VTFVRLIVGCLWGEYWKLNDGTPKPPKPALRLGAMAPSEVLVNARTGGAALWRSIKRAQKDKHKYSDAPMLVALLKGMNCTRDSLDGQRRDLQMVNAKMPRKWLRTTRLSPEAARFMRELRRCLSAYFKWDKGNADTEQPTRAQFWVESDPLPVNRLMPLWHECASASIPPPDDGQKKKEWEKAVQLGMKLITSEYVSSYFNSLFSTTLASNNPERELRRGRVPRAFTCQSRGWTDPGLLYSHDDGH